MKRIIISIIIVINILLLPGCWDIREITDLGMVMAVGIDKIDSGRNHFKVTVQIANPKEHQTNMAGTAQIVWTGNADGETIFDAVRNLARISSKRIMWAHNNIVIIGESLAKQGIAPVVDFFTVNAELRLKTMVVVAKGKAQDYVATRSVGIEDITGIAYNVMGSYSKLQAVSIQTDMLKLFSTFSSQNGQPILSTLTFQNQTVIPRQGQASYDKDTVNLGGSAIFHKDKLIGWLTDEETRGVAWLLKATQNTLVTVSNDPNSPKGISVETRNLSVNITTEIKDNIPAFTVNITAEGSIVEQDSYTTLSIDEFKKQVEVSAAKEITSEIQVSLNKLQKEFKSDVLGWAQTFHIQHKSEWDKSFKDSWESVFPKIPVTINTKINITDNTLNQLPLYDDKKKGGTQ